jgi:hypothetical protein
MDEYTRPREGSPPQSTERWVEWEDPGQGYGYVVVPKAVQRDRRLSRHARFLYELILGYAWDDPTAHPGQDRLCADMGCKDVQLRKYLDELKAAGLLTWRRRGLGLTNLYTIRRVPIAPSTNGPETPKRGYQETTERGSPDPPDQGSNVVTDDEDSGNQDSVMEEGQVDPTVLQTLIVLESIKGFPKDRTKTVPALVDIVTDYPLVDPLRLAKKFKTYNIERPYKRHLSGFRNWMEREAKPSRGSSGGSRRRGGQDSGRADYANTENDLLGGL